MKKSELNKYIKENILSSLSEEESTESTEDIEKKTLAINALAVAKKEAGIEEANIGLADLEEMGYEAGEKAAYTYGTSVIRLQNRPDKLAYNKGFMQGVKDELGSSLNENEGRTKMPTQDQVNKFFSLTQNEMHYLNSKPVAGQEKTFNDTEVEPWDEYDLSNWNSLVKKAKTKGKSIDENEDEVFNPDAKVKKTKGLAKAKEELALLTQEMKSLAKKYSKAEGEDKEKLVKTLKAKTKLKKELESILDKKKI